MPLINDDGYAWVGPQYKKGELPRVDYHFYQNSVGRLRAPSATGIVTLALI